MYIGRYRSWPTTTLNTLQPCHILTTENNSEREQIRKHQIYIAPFHMLFGIWKSQNHPQTQDVKFLGLNTA